MPVLTGTVYDDQGNPAGGRIIRAYRRSDGALVGETLSSDGTYGDPHWNSVSLCLNFNHEPGKQFVYDSSNFGHQGTMVGLATVSADRARSGLASARFYQSGDRVEFPDNDGFELGSGDCTIEFWVNSVASTPSGQGHGFLTKSWATSTSGYGSWVFYRHSTQNLVFYACSATGSWNIASDFVVMPAASFTLNAWHHIAVSRQGTAIRFFANGVLTGTITTALAFLNDAQPLRLGGGAGADQSVNAFIDGVRITKGVSRYNAAFTPSNGPWPTHEVLPLGAYSLKTYETAEVQIVCLDDVAGIGYNDLVQRALPA
jgi:hypothetical protein